MAIAIDDVIEKFAAQETITIAGASTANNAFTIAGTTWTNTNDVQMASMVAMFDWNTTAPTIGTVVNLYGRPIAIQSTNDGNVPNADFPNIYLGSFPIEDVLFNQYVLLDIYLPNTKSQQDWTFYIENKSGQTIEANWELYITPKTIGPKAA